MAPPELKTGQLWFIRESNLIIEPIFVYYNHFFKYSENMCAIYKYMFRFNKIILRRDLQFCIAFFVRSVLCHICTLPPCLFCITITIYVVLIKYEHIDHTGETKLYFCFNIETRIIFWWILSGPKGLHPAQQQRGRVRILLVKLAPSLFC